MAWRLIEQLESLMFYNLSVLEGTPADDAEVVLRILDESRLRQAVDVSRKLFETLGNVSLSNPGSTFPCYYHRIGICWYATSLENKPAKREKLEPFAKAFAELADAIAFTKRAVEQNRHNLLQKENVASTFQRIRQLPGVYREFREHASVKLLKSCC